MQNRQVEIAGYTIPHPNVEKMHIRVQTLGNTKSGEDYTAVLAIYEACETLSSQCDTVLGVVEEIFPETLKDREEMEKRDELNKMNDVEMEENVEETEDVDDFDEMF